MHAQLAATLNGLTEEQARIVWVALSQFTDNTRDAIEYSGSEDPKEIAALTVAESLLAKMDAAFADLAEPRTYQIEDQSPERDSEWKAGQTPTKTVTWDNLAEVNEPETMAEIGLLAVGDSTVLGQCDPITRLT